MTLDTHITVRVITALTSTADLSKPRSDMRWVTDQLWTDGSAANQATKVFQDRRSIAASATDTLDLNGGGLLDDLGQAFAITKLKAIGVKSLSTNTVDIALNRPAANGVPLFSAAGDQIVLKPNTVHLWSTGDANGIAVTAATADLIAVVNLGATVVNYEIVIVGA